MHVNWHLGRSTIRFNDVTTLVPGMAMQRHATKNRNEKPEALSRYAMHEAYLWDGPFRKYGRKLQGRG